MNHTSAAREAHRRVSGQFGVQPRSEASGVALTGPEPMPAAEPEPGVGPALVERRALDVDDLAEHEWFHITPTGNLDSIVTAGVQQGDGRHFKGNA